MWWGAWIGGLLFLFGLSSLLFDIFCDLYERPSVNPSVPTGNGRGFRNDWRFIVYFDAHQPVIDDLEARILTIRDSL